MHSHLSQVLFFTVLLFSLNGYAQKGTQSPYSVYGIGELKSGKYAYFSALGGAQIANTDSTIITLSNPASYAGLDRNRPVFQVGLNGSFTKLSTTNSTATTSQMGLDQFQLGLPIAKNFGASVGLSPFSSTGYLISNPIIEEGDTIAEKINEGQGTISNFHIGLGYKQKIKKNSSISLGVNLNYLFGSNEKIESFEYTEYPNDALHSRVKSATYVNDFRFDFGLLYAQKLARGSYTLAATYTPAASLKSSTEIVSYAYSQSFYDNYSYYESISDTSNFLTDLTGTTYIPESYGVGGEYRLRPGTTSNLNYQIIFKGEYNYQKWSDFKTTFEGVVNDSVYADRTNLSFGIEYAPYANAKANDKLVMYLAKLKYRFGFNYTMTEIMAKNTQLNNYGISFGLGIPVLNGNSNTNINLGVTYNNLGTINNNLIQEQKLGVSFGVSISPGIYDRWFLKRKYD
ncbi:hypothetical protein DNU06_02380 [Putridiphycobacter roseus]|uniref:Aromatic hydrocarbon degradation protein n=1 Tax=Putridiphycobacter roseus TaxID=2219161 RepID=A0A2W1NGR6_9FLAO|nr:hypothetical protein [Putridiphycobacter roseus]PZE18695.1 hypothetical protein DNU06_02380 [Putridiphycobacter roseus]